MHAILLRTVLTRPIAVDPLWETCNLQSVRVVSRCQTARERYSPDLELVRFSSSDRPPTPSSIQEIELAFQVSQQFIVTLPAIPQIKGGLPFHRTEAARLRSRQRPRRSCPRSQRKWRKREVRV
jgi:hypothetical protein